MVAHTLAALARASPRLRCDAGRAGAGRRRRSSAASPRSPASGCGRALRRRHARRHASPPAWRELRARGAARRRLGAGARRRALPGHARRWIDRADRRLRRRRGRRPAGAMPLADTLKRERGRPRRRRRCRATASGWRRRRRCSASACCATRSSGAGDARHRRGRRDRGAGPAPLLVPGCAAELQGHLRRATSRWPKRLLERGAHEAA